MSLNSECLDHALNQFIAMKMPKTQFFSRTKKSNYEVVRISSKIRGPLESSLHWVERRMIIMRSHGLIASPTESLKQSHHILILNRSYMQLLRDEMWPPDSLEIVEDTKTLWGSSEIWSAVIVSFRSTLI